MNTLIPTITAILIASAFAPLATAAEEPADAFLFVSFELGDVRALAPFNAVLTASFANATAETAITARQSDTLQGSLSLPVDANSGNWSVDLALLDGTNILHVQGVLSKDSIQIFGSRVDSTRLDLPPETTSLRVIKGYVSATVTLIGQLKADNCCTATLGIDADADGLTSAAETKTVQATGREVRATMRLDRAAPSVPYVFTINDATGKVVARASGTYSFTKLNGVSASGEFDPTLVEYVTGNVEREPHLLQHDISSSLLLQRVAGNERQEPGPRVFFTMGTPGTAPASQPPMSPGDGPVAPVETNAYDGALGSSSLGQRILGLFTGPVFLAILIGSLVAATLAFFARRMLERVV